MSSSNRQGSTSSSCHPSTITSFLRTNGASISPLPPPMLLSSTSSSAEKVRKAPPPTLQQPAGGGTRIPQRPECEEQQQQQQHLPTALSCLSASNNNNNKNELKESEAGLLELAKSSSIASTMNETWSTSTSSMHRKKFSLTSPTTASDDNNKRFQSGIAGAMTSGFQPSATALQQREIIPDEHIDLSVLHQTNTNGEQHSSRGSSVVSDRLRSSIGSLEDVFPGQRKVGKQHFVTGGDAYMSPNSSSLDLSAVNLADHVKATDSSLVRARTSIGSLDEMVFDSHIDDDDDENPSPVVDSNSKLTPPSSLNGTPVKLFSQPEPVSVHTQPMMLPPQQLATVAASTSSRSSSATPTLYSAIGSLEDPLSSSYKLSSSTIARLKKKDFPSALRTNRKHKSASRENNNSNNPATQPSVQRKVTLAEPTPQKTRKKQEFFRPSSDAYTPRMGKRKIAYKPAANRTPVMTSSMGTLSRPNFSDALRRVAMILRQHVVKIEGRFEDDGDDDRNDGLFSKAMQHLFCEGNFVVPRYRCTMVRVPMARSGMACGMKKIEARYEIPTEHEIYEFAHRLFQTVQLSSECSIVSLIYVERMMEVSKVPLLASTWKPIFMCGLLMASKVWQDLNSWNVEFANVYPQFQLDSINKLELQFLRMIKWDLYISSSLYAKYYFALRSLVDKRDFRQRYNRMVGGIDSVRAEQARQIQERTALVKEEALLQLSQSM